MFRRFAPALLTVALLAGPAVVAAQPASAASAPGPRGNVLTATQHTFARTITVRGWAADTRTPRRNIGLRFYADGVYLGRTMAGRPGHRFVVTFPRMRWTRTITARSTGTGRVLTFLSARTVQHVQAPASARLVTVASWFVGRARYVSGGATPQTGFDCSGYTQYVYRRAGVAMLSHYTDTQRNAPRMHRVSAAAARPGDLVFYMSGSHSYHVAVYAGNHMQYAAATPRDGIVHQAVWSANVIYTHYV